VTWAEACAALLEGKKVRKDGWEPLDYYWHLAPCRELYGVPVLMDSLGQRVSLMRLDMEATDWEVIPNENQ
jgi:hypothetical protein